MFTKRFWVSAAERAVKSFAYSLLILWPVGDVALNMWDVDWKKALGGAGMVAITSVLGSLVSAPIGPDNSPSLVGEPPTEPEAILGDEAGAHARDGVGRDGQPEVATEALFGRPTQQQVRKLKD